jgi:Zn-dependent peptidase ImmA (M78 family)
MNLLLDSMLEHFPKLNRRPYGWEDIELITKKHRINLTVTNYNPEILGYYCTRKTAKRVKKFIMVNAILDEMGRTFIGLHELAHYFLHVPITSRQYFYCRRNALQTEAKHDAEANAVALIAMIPLWMLIDHSGAGFDTLEPEFVNLLIRRQRVWESWGL